MLVYADCLTSDWMYKFYSPSNGGGYEEFRELFDSLTKLDVTNTTNMDVVLFLEPHEERNNTLAETLYGKATRHVGVVTSRLSCKLWSGACYV